MKVNQTMNIIPDDELCRWSAADLDIFKELNMAAPSFAPAASLPVVVAGIFAPRGVVAFRRCLAVLAAALGVALIETGADASAVEGAVAQFTAETEAEARRLWLGSVGPGAEEATAVH